MAEEHQLICSDKKKIYYREWIPENGNIHAVVQIFHGMAEHGLRYDRFATYLTTLGIAVYAQDHRGHGLTATDDDLGFFAQKHGWMRVVQDGFELSELIAQKHTDKDLFLFGHSMGSFLVRTLIVLHPDRYRGAILSGTSAGKGLLGAIGKLIASVRSLQDHGKRADVLLDSLSFGKFNTPFEPAKTGFDWLSRDEKEVQAYIDDPLCGFVCTSKFFNDLLYGISFANSRTKAQQIPKEFPLYIISGANDPVGDFGKGVEKVYHMYRGVGIQDVTVQIVKGARHELLNETNREDIQRDIGRWLETHKSRKNR